MKRPIDRQSHEIPIDSWEEAKFQVDPLTNPPVVHFCPHAIDKLSEVLEDHLATGGSVKTAAAGFYSIIASDIRAEVLNSTLLFFSENGNKRQSLLADVIRYVSGLAAREGLTGPKLARRHKMTKQAFHKHCVSAERKYPALCGSRREGKGKHVEKSDGIDHLRALLRWWQGQRQGHWPKERRDLWRRELARVAQAGQERLA